MHGGVGGPFHDLFHPGHHLVHCVFIHFEQQLVMHLQQHGGRQAGNRVRHPDHRAADHICRRALDRRIDRGAAGKAGGRPFGVDLGRIDPPPEQGLHVACLPRKGDGLFHVFLDTRKAFEIAVDEPLGIGTRNTKVARKAEARDTIDHAEVDRLGLAADHRIHPLDRHVEHLGCGHGMNVEPLLERLFQRRDVGDMGQDAQFDLAVIQADQHLALRGHKSFSDAPSFLGAHGNVLQVRIGRGEASGDRPGEGIRGVDAPGFRVDMVLQRIGIGRLQLGQLTPVQHPRGQVVPFGGQVFQHIGPGGIGPGLALDAAGQAELVEQDLAQLLGAAHVEAFAGERVDFRLQPRHFLRKGIRHARQRIAVHLDAGHFHRGQDRHQRAFQCFIDGGYLRLVQLRLEGLPQAQRHVGVFGGVFHRLVHRDVVEGDHALARAEQRLDRDRHMAQILFGQRIHAMPVQAGMHGIAHEHGVIDGGHRNAVPRQDLGVVFHVLPDLQDRVVFQHRFQHRQDGIQGQLPRHQIDRAEQIATALSVL